MQDQILRVLFDTDRWAMRQLLAECQRLSQEQFERELVLGAESLERTVTHMVSTLFYFADRLERRPARPRLERAGQRHSAAELSNLYERGADELDAAVTSALARHALSHTLNWTDSDEGEIAAEDQVSYAVALAQMVDHAIHHRTQVMDMLKLLGVERPMPWHPFDWDEAVRPNT
jgi:uncharacterized damage-inducible protein DinB